MKRSLRLGLPCLALSVMPFLGAAQINVFLDYSGIDGQIDAGWADAGLGTLTSAEREGIKSSIKTGTESVYSGFAVNFTNANPGGVYETVTFGSYLGEGFYGLAERIDWRNRFKDDVTQVSTRTHGEILSPSFSRAENLRRYTDGIANTVAHELGHNIGLQHYDTYGVSTIYNKPGDGSTYGNTRGVQNRSVMATGDTGASLDDFAVLPRFSDLERMKLEFAEGLSPALGLTINEVATVHNTRATAQPLTFQTLSLSNVPAVNIAGTIGAGQTDWYSFDAFQGSSFLANVLASDPEIPGNGTLDSILTLYDANGNVLFRNDDITYNGNAFNTGLNADRYGLDSMILNYEFSAFGTNRYYLSINSFAGNESGAYNLLVRPVPEPASLAALALGFVAVLRRRRK